MTDNTNLGEQDMPASLPVLPTNNLAVTTPNTFQNLGSIDSIPVSRTFNLIRSPLPDLCLVSSDGVFFYAHLNTIHRQCPEAFGSYLDSPSSTTDHPMNTVVLDCPSTVLNIIIHALYDISPASYEPSADIIISSVDLMPAYAIRPEKVIFPECALYDYILAFMPLRPLDVYSMAAHHKIHPLAVHASSYLHGIDTHLIAEDVCIRIGPVYLTKLARLHVQRSTALKDALLVPPEMHPAMPNCTLKQQHGATRVWAHLCADPIWDTKPVDLAVQSIENTLQKLMGNLTCPDCRSNLNNTASKVRLRWASVPRRYRGHLAAISGCKMKTRQKMVFTGL